MIKSIRLVVNKKLSCDISSVEWVEKTKDGYNEEIRRVITKDKTSNKT